GCGCCCFCGSGVDGSGWDPALACSVVSPRDGFGCASGRAPSLITSSGPITGGGGCWVWGGGGGGGGGFGGGVLCAGGGRGEPKACFQAVAPVVSSVDHRAERSIRSAAACSDHSPDS